MSYREHALRKRELGLKQVEEGKEERAVERVIYTGRDTKYEPICGLSAHYINWSDHALRINNHIAPRISQHVSHIFTADMQVLKHLSKIYKKLCW